MKAEITRDVVQDLLPLYLAGEASEDTVALVEAYLEIDAEMAEIARQAANNGLLGKVPVPLRKEDAMEAYASAKRRMIITIVALATVIAITVLFIAAFVRVAVMF